MSVGQEEAAVIRREWEERFKSLPPDGSFTGIPIEKQLKWVDLPRRSSRRDVPSSITTHVDGSSALENPPINQVTGPGRTTADVQQELHSYQKFTPAAARSSGGLPAIFQADFCWCKFRRNPWHCIVWQMDCASTMRQLLT